MQPPAGRGALRAGERVRRSAAAHKIAAESEAQSVFSAGGIQSAPSSSAFIPALAAIVAVKDDQLSRTAARPRCIAAAPAPPPLTLLLPP